LGVAACACMKALCMNKGGDKIFVYRILAIV